ncbi:hypothetical protein SALBM217S_07581 [Streptomyces griseoloalbus]
MVLLSKVFENSRHAASVRHALTGWADDTGRSPVVAVRVDEVQHLPESFVDLLRLDEGECVTALLRALDLPLQPVESASSAPRFPGNTPAIWNAPQRSATFTGRNTILERVRNQLGGTGGPPQPQALWGLGGVGKTQLAVEYVHRFMAD